MKKHFISVQLLDTEPKNYKRAFVKAVYQYFMSNAIGTKKNVSKTCIFSYFDAMVTKHSNLAFLVTVKS